MANKVSTAVIAGISAFIGFLALNTAHKEFFTKHDLTCLCPPLGAVAVLLFSMPNAPASQPKAVVGGHILAGCISLAVLEYLPKIIKLKDVPFMEGMEPGIAVALTITAMAIMGVTHPPAGAYAFFVTSQKLTAKAILAPGLAGALILVAVQQVIMKLRNKDQIKID